MMLMSRSTPVASMLQGLQLLSHLHRKLDKPLSYGVSLRTPSRKARQSLASTSLGVSRRHVLRRSSCGDSSSGSVSLSFAWMPLPWKKSDPLALSSTISSCSATFKMMPLFSPHMVGLSLPTTSLMHGCRPSMLNKDKVFDIEASALPLDILNEIGPMFAWNARGLLASNPALHRRKLAVAEHLLCDANVGVFVESHGTRFEYEPLFPEFTELCSLIDGSRGSLVICLRTSWLPASPIDFKQIVKVRLSRTRMASRLFDEFMLSIYAVHLEAESHQFADQLAMLDLLHDVVSDDATPVNIMIGTWNFECFEPECDEIPPMSYAHSRLLRRFKQLFPGWCLCDPDAPTLLGPFRALES